MEIVLDLLRAVFHVAVKEIGIDACACEWKRLEEEHRKLSPERAREIDAAMDELERTKFP